MKESISNQERLMREKALKKPITEHPKKSRNVLHMNQNHQALDVVEQIRKLKIISCCSVEQTPNMPENMKTVTAEEESGASLLSVDDFERRGFNINEVRSQCATGFDALLVVTELARQILHEEEEEIIKKRRKKKQKLMREKALKTPMIKRRSFLDDEEWVCQPSRFNKHNRPCYNQVVHDMPVNMRKLIESMNGDNIKLVIQKHLFHTDMNDHHHRMSIPMRQIRAEFLTEEEKTWLDDGKRQMTPLFVQPSLAVSEIAFKRWTTTHSYVLCTGWNDVKAANGLKEGDQVQLWSFRINQHLCLALARVGQAIH